MRPWTAGWLVIASVAAAAGEERGIPRAAVTTAGERFLAAFNGIDADGRFVFATAGGSRTLPLGELVRWGQYTDTARGAWLEMDDGSLLVAQGLELDERRVAVETAAFGRVELPLARLRGIAFDPPLATLERDRLRERLAAAPDTEDRLLLADGEAVGGTVRRIAAAREGPQAGLTTVEFSAAGRDFSLAQDQVTAVVFRVAPGQRTRPTPGVTWFGLRDGSLIAATDLRRSGDRLRLSRPDGLVLDADAERFPDEVVLVQPLASADYVSDLTGAVEDAIPFLRAAWPAARDRSVLGGRLRCQGGVFLKGLGMHSTTRLAYPWDGAPGSLEAELAIDELAGVAGSVVFKVYLLDEAGTWKRAFESPVVRGGQPPLPMAVDLRGARAMALIAEFSERGDVQDYANWLDLRVVRGGRLP